MKDMYTAAYFIGHAYGDDPKRAAMKEQEAARIKARVRGGTVLDVGCGIGDFLDHFPGWTKYGVEVSEYAAEEARKRGLFVVEDIDDIEAKLDLVIWRGTFQHLDEPMRALKRCVKLLKPGGVIAFLATPNSNSLVYKLFGDLPALDAPRNFVVPSDKMLTNILKNLGLRNIEVLYPYKGTPYASPVRDFGKFALALFGKHSKFAFPGSMMEVYCVK